MNVSGCWQEQLLVHCNSLVIANCLPAVKVSDVTCHFPKTHAITETWPTGLQLQFQLWCRLTVALQNYTSVHTNLYLLLEVGLINILTNL